MQSAAIEAVATTNPVLSMKAAAQELSFVRSIHRMTSYSLLTPPYFTVSVAGSVLSRRQDPRDSVTFLCSAIDL